MEGTGSIESMTVLGYSSLKTPQRRRDFNQNKKKIRDQFSWPPCQFAWPLKDLEHKSRCPYCGEWVDGLKEWRAELDHIFKYCRREIQHSNAPLPYVPNLTSL